MDTGAQDIDPAVLAERVTFWRKKKGLTQYALAKATGLSHPHIKRLEEGRVKVPGYVTLGKLALALDIYPEQLVMDEESAAALMASRAASLQGNLLARPYYIREPGDPYVFNQPQPSMEEAARMMAAASQGEYTAEEMRELLVMFDSLSERDRNLILGIMRRMAEQNGEP
jgi:transcriptional regulator with XRE-family HTH domain